MVDKLELENKINETGKIDDVASYFNCSKGTIRNYLKHHAVVPPKGFYSKGKKNGRPKGIPMAEKQKRFLSDLFKGENNPFHGKFHNQSSLTLMRQNHADFSGENNPFYKKWNSSLEERKKHSDRCLKIWSDRTPEERNRLAKNQMTGCGQMSGTQWASILNNAKGRRLEMNVDANYCWNLFLQQDGKCALSGVSLTFSKPDANASLDRIDNTRGYEEGNLQWVHKIINIMKNRLTNEQFVACCISVVENSLKGLQPTFVPVE